MQQILAGWIYYMSSQNDCLARTSSFRPEPASQPHGVYADNNSTSVQVRVDSLSMILLFFFAAFCFQFLSLRGGKVPVTEDI